MASNIDVRKVMHALGDSRMVNLDISLRELVDSSAVDLINSHAHLDPWDLICYTWITFIRRGSLDEIGFPDRRGLGGPGPAGGGIG